MRKFSVSSRNFSRVFCCFKIPQSHQLYKLLILFFCFQSSFSYSQDIPKDSLHKTFIYLDQSVQIFSDDELFTQQLLNSSLIVENKSVTDVGDLKSKVVSGGAEVEIGKLSEKTVSAFQNELEKTDEAKEVDKKIEEFKHRQKDFLKQEFISHQSTEEFHAGKQISKTYIAPGFYFYDLERFFDEKDFSAKEGLKFIHTQNFSNYNVKAFCFCFSTVFSVRPPPFFS